MFENLEEAIILLLNGEIQFINKVFTKLLLGLNIIESHSEAFKAEVMDIKMFKLFRSD